MITKRFLVALSFPGEYRDYVSQVAEALAKSLGKDKVLGLYDLGWVKKLSRKIYFNCWQRNGNTKRKINSQISCQPIL